MNHQRRPCAVGCDCARHRRRYASRGRFLDMAAMVDDVREVLWREQGLLAALDPNRGRIGEACDYLEAAAGRLRCVV